MKIFVFEYLTGGGLRDQSLPECLANEGELMLKALITDLSQIPHIELYITRDSRLPDHYFRKFANVQLIKITPYSNIQSIFVDLGHQCDAVWPIAPESGSILFNFSRIVEESGTQLLNSTAEAVKLTGNKLLTSQQLSYHKIPVVMTQKLSSFQWMKNESYVIKPYDGVGCENCFLIKDQEQLEHAVAFLEDPDDYIIQPFIWGRAISLSCLFKNGHGWLICVNEQKISNSGQKISLDACKVNIAQANLEKIIGIIERIAQAIPGLWGYVGIDLVDIGNDFMLIEINPRLTISYAGISQALGINVAENVLKLISDEPDLEVVGETFSVKVQV
jgi:predicted ATP-grasp superfamily ATP-dependent carboligase